MRFLGKRGWIFLLLFKDSGRFLFKDVVKPKINFLQFFKGKMGQEKLTRMFLQYLEGLWL